MGSLEEAVMSIPENLAGLSYSDPLGIDVGNLADSHAVAESTLIFNITTGFSGTKL